MAIKQAKVSEVNAEDMTARVTYEDRDGFVSRPMRILCQGSGTNYHYWLPDVGEQVVVAEFDEGNGEGCIIGSFYSHAVPPENKNGNIRKIKFSNGDYIQHNRATGDLDIIVQGNVTINGKNIFLN